MTSLALGGERGTRRRNAHLRRGAAVPVLRPQGAGEPVTLEVMPDSSHAYVAGRGWDVVLAAFPEAAARD